MGWFNKFINKVKKIGKSFNKTIQRVGKNIYDTINNKETITKEELTKQEAEAFLISRQAYRTTKLKQVGNYTLNETLTNEDTVIYQDFNNNLFIGYRGSKVAKDWTESNFNILKHNEANSERFNKDLEYFDYVVNNLKPNNIYLVGHSLSGLIVLYINSKRNNIKQVYSINPAFNLNAFNTYYRGNVLIMRTLNDIVSSLSTVSRFKVKTIKTQYDDEATFLNILKSHGLGSVLDNSA